MARGNLNPNSNSNPNPNSSSNSYSDPNPDPNPEQAAQTGLPMCALAATGGLVRLPPAQRVQVLMQVGPWAMRHAVGGVDLLCVYYEREMDKGLEQLRRELSIEPLFK